MPLAMVEREPPDPPPIEQLAAVALDQIDPVERHAELAGDDLRERCLVALAMVLGSRDHRDAPVRAEAQPAHLLADRRGHLEIHRQAAAA